MRNFIALAWKDRSLRHQANRASIHPVSGPTSGSEPDREDVGFKSWHSSLVRISSWPEEARPLKERNWISNLYLVGDIVLVLAPIFFLLLGIAVITLHRKPTEGNSFGSKVEFATQLGPTIFPIVFAAIIGRSMKMIARYLAEKGAKLSTLELMMASQSVWGTVESQLLMRRLTVVGIHLLFLWSLSPLGGQASLRLLQTADWPQYTSAKLRYLTTGPGGSMWGLGTIYDGGQGFRDVNALYGASLFAPNTIKSGPQDAWGNVKIPSLEPLNASEHDADGWFTVPTITSAEGYSSLIGLPVVGRPLDADANFSLESTYISAQCDPFVFIPEKSNLSNYYSPQWWSPTTNDTMFTQTSFFLDTDQSGSIGYFSGQSQDEITAARRLDSFFGHENKSATDDPLATSMRKLIMGSLYQGAVNLVNCSLSQTHVEAIVNCTKNQCGVQRIRRSQTDARPTNFTGLEHFDIVTGFLKNLPTAFNTGAGSTPTERFLFNTNSTPTHQTTGLLNDALLSVLFVNLTQVPIETFSRRLSVILNTYYQLSVAPTGYSGDLPQNLSLYGPDTLPVSDVSKYLPSNVTAANTTFYDWWPLFFNTVGQNPAGVPFIGATTNGTIVHHQEIFVCNFGWLSLLLAASGVIFFTGLAGLLLKRKTLAPELFGFVTSMTYENPYINIPEGGGVLDAMERARLLKDLKVRVGDVQGNEEVGHVALGTGANIRRLERGRSSGLVCTIVRT